MWRARGKRRGDGGVLAAWLLMRCMRGPRKKKKSGDLVWNSDDA